MSSIKDVAKKAGVSISTVSNVLNGTKFVSEELKKKVAMAVKELGYVADPTARNMKMKKSKTIGVITADLCGLFYPYVLKGIYEIANEKGYSVIIYDTSGTYEEGNSLDREKEYFKSLISSKVDGIIFCSVVPENMEKVYLQEIKDMASLKKEVVLVSIERDFSDYGIDSVYSDSYHGGKKATEYLLSLGCKKIGHIAGPLYSVAVHDRIKGYQDTLKKEKLLEDEDKNIVFGDFSHQSGYTAMRELLEKMPDLDGVYIANDQMAIGACMYLKECKKKIPEEIKLIGYDDVFVSSIVDPTISTIHVSTKKMGLEAARALFKKIENEDQDQETIRIELPTRLVERQTTRKGIDSDWILSDW